MNRPSTARGALAPLFWTALVACAGLVLPAPPLLAQAPPSGDRYELFGTFQLEVDGKAEPEALLYHVEQPRAVLVRSTALGVLTRILPATQQVEIYDPSALAELPEGAVALKPDARPRSTGPFTVDREGPAWSAGERRARLVTKPPLLGLHARAGLIAHDRTYELKSRAYQTIPQYLAELKSLAGPLRVRVFFGSWCSTCAQLLPHILKVEQELAGSGIRFEYYGLPQGYNEPEAKRLSITSVPTGILYRGDQQVGRIEPSSFRFPELAIKNALAR